MKIAIVTGASSGLGKETVLQLADRFGGLDAVWIVARRMERLKELEMELPLPVRCFSIDLSNIEEIDGLKQALKTSKPNVKFLVNAAGFGKIGKIGEISLQDEADMIGVNCQSLCAVTSTVLPYMAKNSRIIQYASSAAFFPQPGFAIYAATKSFVLSYSRALNEEVRERGICVTAVCPGPVATEFFEIAETTGKLPIYKALFMAKPKAVVHKALRDSMMGRAVSIYGPTMKIAYVGCRILPHSVLMRIMSRMNR